MTTKRSGFFKLPQVRVLDKLFGRVQGVDIPTKELYENILIDYFYRNISTRIHPVGKMRYLTADAIGSGTERICFLYTVDSLDAQIPVNWHDLIRTTIAGNPDIRVSFVDIYEPKTLDWNSAKMQSKLRTWRGVAQENSENDVDAYNYNENQGALSKEEWRERSLVYLSSAGKKRNRRLFEYRTLMLVQGIRSDDFDRSLKAILDACKSMGIDISRVSGDIENYIKYFSPASLDFYNKVHKEIASHVAPDEIISRFSDYAEGKVGVGKIYWGTDIYSGTDVWDDIKKTGVDAENILTVAETGGGKSFFIKTLLLNILADDRFTGTINDIEGDEYTPLYEAVKAGGEEAVLLNMAEGTGSYYDPVAVVSTGDPVLDEGMYGISNNYTVAIFKALMGEDRNNMWVNNIIRDAVSQTYKDAGVTQDPSTWSRSEGLTLKTVYQNIRDTYNPDYVAPEIQGLYKDNNNYKDARDKVIAQLSNYFDASGTQAGVFRNPINVGQIRTARLVVCSFGLKGKGEAALDPVQVSLMQLYAANISHLRSIFSQNRNKFNFKVWEEFQRWSTLPDAEKTIKTALTGGRKLGDVNIIITNNVKQLLDEDKFAVFESYTSIAIGSIRDSDIRTELAHRLGISNMLPDLNEIAKASRVKTNNALVDDAGADDTASIYKNAFLVHLHRSVDSIVKINAGEKLAHSPLFWTGVEATESDTSIETSSEEVAPGLTGVLDDYLDMEDWDDEHEEDEPDSNQILEI